MAEGLDFEISTKYRDANFLAGNAVADALRLDVSKLVGSCNRAAAPGLMALRSNVAGIKSKTGRLGRSPAVKSKVYKTGNNWTALALVGYDSGIAPHAYYIEYGSRNRQKRGAMPAFFPLQRAFESTRETMKATMQNELQKIMAEAAKRLAG